MKVNIFILLSFSIMYLPNSLLAQNNQEIICQKLGEDIGVLIAKSGECTYDEECIIDSTLIFDYPFGCYPITSKETIADKRLIEVLRDLLVRYKAQCPVSGKGCPGVPKELILACRQRKCVNLGLYSETPSKEDSNIILARELYENGTVKSEIPRLAGKKHGVERSYYPNGIVEREITYKNNIADGPEIRYYEDGSVKFVS